jgi:thiol-disulfide isomerase/thioredoxin
MNNSKNTRRNKSKKTNNTTINTPLDTSISTHDTEPEIVNTTVIEPQPTVIVTSSRSKQSKKKIEPNHEIKQEPIINTKQTVNDDVITEIITEVKTEVNNNGQDNGQDNDDNENENNDDGSIKTKRRGRKPKDKFKYESTDIDEYAKNNRKEENIIIKLPLSCLKLNEEFNDGKDLFNYNPTITTPKPYNSEDLSSKHNINYSLLDGQNNDDIENNINPSVKLNDQKPINCPKCSTCECHSKQIGNSSNIVDGTIKSNTENINVYGKSLQGGLAETRQIDIILNNKYNSNTDKFNVLTHLGNSLNGNKWPEKTEIACLWCCHRFNNTPWGVPFKFHNDKFQLFGNFCMPNCVLSYILQNYKEDDAMWEKVALLNLLYFKVYGEYKTLVPAFDKMSLKTFGGTLEIEEYRNIIGKNDKSYSIEFPPCNTIIPMLEEIYKKTNLNNTFIPVDKTRIQVANNELKLKRSKPVVNVKNTLDFCLGKNN